MNRSINFDDIYNDFFAKKEETKETITKEDNLSTEEVTNKLKTLYITEESRGLLEKIINYIENYTEKALYVNFNIELVSNNKEANKEIVDLIAQIATKNNYIDNNSIENISMYKLENADQLEESYKNNGLIILNDLDGITTHDSNFNKKIIHIIKEHLSDHLINIIVGTKDNIDNFFMNNLDDKNNCFNFKIEVINPNSSEILNDIIDRVGDSIDKKTLLNYIDETFIKSDLDYPTYRDNLCKYISFNNKLPDLEKTKTTEEIFKDLNELVGLEKVKKSLYELVDLITLKNKTKGDLKLKNINLHMLFLGNPGTGKTTVARMLGNILYNLGYIRQNKLTEVSSKDLVAEYVGQTAPKTMEVVNRSLGGILFIDEAYALATDKTNSYNKEAIATLIKAMEDKRDDLVVIFAGYTKEMQDFINSNSGISSRIGYTFTFDDYTNKELKQIFINMMNKSGFKVLDESLDELDSLIDKERTTNNFGNARFIRNVYEKTIILHATNTKKIKDKEKLKTITKEDINC